MNNEQKICFTCRKSEFSKFYKVRDYDFDQITYLEKLKQCVSPDLFEMEEMEMCWVCVKHLRICYKFRGIVLASQELLRGAPTNIEDEPFQDNLSKSDSDSECYDGSDDCSTKNILETVDCFMTQRQICEKNEIRLNCDYCGSHFAKQWQLKKHITRVHNESRKFVCTYCSKEFKQSYHLKEHITSHTGEKNYSCPICDKKFQRLSSQRRHIKSHDAPPGHKTKRTPFLCTVCGKSFPFSNGVQRHMRIHLGIKNFPCSLCNRRFTQSTHLQVHMRTHTGEKPYICDTCGEKFSLKSCMLKHINTRHYGERKSLVVDDLPHLFYMPKDEFEHHAAV